MVSIVSIDVRGKGKNNPAASDHWGSKHIPVYEFLKQLSFHNYLVAHCTQKQLLHILLFSSVPPHQVPLLLIWLFPSTY